MVAYHTRVGAAAIAALALLAAIASAQIIDVPPQDAAFNAAIDKARQTLPAFFARVASPQEGDSGFLIKIAYPKKNSTGKEHIWAKDVLKRGDAVMATIDNEPRDIADLAKGDRVTVPVAQITDWLYVRDGKYVGAYTLRALLPFMDKQTADKTRAMLSDE